MKKGSFFSGDSSFRKSVYILGTILVLAICAFATLFMIYTRNLNENAEQGLLATTNELVPNNRLELLDTSTSEDKNITEKESVAQNEISNQTSESESQANLENTVAKKKENLNQNVQTNQEENRSGEDEQSTEEVVDKFMPPVSGEIMKDYADETLLYSETLKEWTTHFGIDIKADKTTVVAAGAKGVVESIKNDPRYGLTVTISHPGNFKTVYSNLLTAEFVTEGENVEEGQTIGTVGTTASFEVADEPHLHFEVWKDNECVNPTMYLK